ncbi:olfactory receptor 52A1-like [Alligator mississippiensis]|uniref:olfactory receptor 52A1-like n=1 Tax=Alligator mississippiensis TaxID=8496 RepID=UPI002877AA49|nr:olfactory receptor 52A1-like [Alligator mississippiensis]
MPAPNLTKVYFNPSTLTLLGIPGLEGVQFWIALPFCVVYVLAILGNLLLLAVIKTERSLHSPMYIFLAMLAVTDLGLSTCITPKILGNFWFGSSNIGFNACLVQMFFIHTFQGMESGVLLAMAFDRYVAVCNPLRYSSILTDHFLCKMGLAIVIRPTILSAPCAFLIKRLQFYKSTIISHSYCEHMAVVKLAAVDIRINKAYGLFVAFTILGVDIIFIAVSYVLIFRAVFMLPQKEGRLKAFHTCTAHICVFLEFYILGFFSFLTHRFGHHVAPYIHILLSNLYLLVPPLLNPIVYGVNTKQIRQRVREVLWLKSSSSKH